MRHSEVDVRRIVYKFFLFHVFSVFFLRVRVLRLKPRTYIIHNYELSPFGYAYRSGILENANATLVGLAKTAVKMSTNAAWLTRKLAGVRTKFVKTCPVRTDVNAFAVSRKWLSAAAGKMK